jgi:dolichol-phosphate mannosyltransferase
VKVLVVMPTYCERESLAGTVGRLRVAVPQAEVLVVDDASPDGTGQVADALAQDDPGVHVLHRAGKQGLGPAYVDGFGWGLARGFEVLVEMDADGSHAPEQLPLLLAAVEGGADLALGSRWVPGGAVVDWPWRRQLLSRAGNTYARWAMGVGLADATGGYRAVRAEALRGIDLAGVQSAGYCFQLDLVWRVLRAGGRVVEVPITFTERAAGRSKMSRAIVAEALWRTTAWGAARRVEQLRTLAAHLRRPAPVPGGRPRQPTGSR